MLFMENVLIELNYGGGPENRTLEDTIRARERRSPLLPPVIYLPTVANRCIKADYSSADAI